MNSTSDVSVVSIWPTIISELSMSSVSNFSQQWAAEIIVVLLYRLIIFSKSILLMILRTEVRGDFNPRNQIFLGCCFPSKIRNLWCCKPPVPLVGQTTRSLDEILTRLVITENCVFNVFSNNQLCQYFMERTGCLANQKYRRLITSLFYFIFDGKQHTKNIWFHHPWLLFLTKNMNKNSTLQYCHHMLNNLSNVSKKWCKNNCSENCQPVNAASTKNVSIVSPQSLIWKLTRLSIFLPNFRNYVMEIFIDCIYFNCFSCGESNF